MMSNYTKAERKQFSKNTQEYIIKPLLKQRETGELCDVELKLNGRTFYAHRAILALWSPYFLSMFTCDMREKQTAVIDLSQSLIVENDDVFEQILNYMYTGNLVLNNSNVEDVVRVSDFFLMDDVKDYCSQFYLELGNLDLTNCLRLKYLSENHNLPHVASACQSMIQSRFHDYLVYHDEIIELPGVYLFRILEDPLVVRHCKYNQLKKLVHRWIDADKDARSKFQADLSACIKLWVCEHISDVPVHSKCSTSVIMQSTSNVVKSEDNMSASVSQVESIDSSIRPKNNNLPSKLPVLYSIVSNQGMKFVKVMVYNITHQKWLHFPLASEKIVRIMPVRQTIGNMISHKNHLYMYLCSSFPYPTDMMKINILVVDTVKVQASLYSFKTMDYYNPCYRTTLTNCRTVPPAMVYCNQNLYIVGNKEGTGHLFLCNLHTQEYKCYQIPGTRFISLARATVKGDRFIFLWFRYRTGPSEEFCIKKSVGFAMFDVKSKIFNTWDIAPPEVSYEEFASPYTLCCRDDTILIYYPGKPTSVLDEVRYKWITSMRRLPAPSHLTKLNSESIEPDFSRFQLQAATDSSIFILNNDAPYTTSMYEVSESLAQACAHTPPPIDQISMVTGGHMSHALLQELQVFDGYDDVYATSLHVPMRVSDPETEDSGGTSNSERDSDNDFEYDEDIYDYDYDLDAEFAF
ncbi:uncharacterized protein LOC128208968 [Mya arenaria]|uniref:uncharacterized protein LOC128208968 n=1 Tax=Mya arenaria TaxID=6604 RepID=UPI0022E37535|nr:uncharacterized protein LOC128208968 [Mya arenaria]